MNLLPSRDASAKTLIRHSPISNEFYNILHFEYFYKSYLVRFIAIQRIFRENFSTTIRNIILLEHVLIVSHQPWNQNGINEAAFEYPAILTAPRILLM